jgi:hypothetical protein
MKTHPVSVGVVLPAGIALIVVVCAIAQTHAPRADIHKTFVKIHPGTKISSDDLKALDAILKSYRKSLYKIRTYDRGKLVRTQGGLEDARIDQRLVAEVNEAALRGVSYVAIQIGNENFPTPWPTPTPTDYSPAKVPHTPAPAPNTAGKWPMEVREMVNRVAPILQKYSQ